MAGTALKIFVSDIDLAPTPPSPAALRPQEHCSGGDLYHRHIVRGGSEERWACCAVVAPLLAVLARLHGHYRVVHRDIKLENIFHTGGGALRLGDFGLSLVLGEELPFARAGTLDYMVRRLG